MKRPLRLRTVLFAPGDSPRKMENALGLGLDAVILDLEDSVVPESRPEARRAIARVLMEAGRIPSQRVVRVSHLPGWWDSEDIALVRELIESSLIDAVMIPKTESAADVSDFMAVLGHHLPVLAVATETPVSIPNLVEIAAHPDVIALSWGPEDLSVGMGSFGARDEHKRLLPVYEWVRWQALIAAKAAEIAALDTVYVDFEDEAGLRRESQEAATAGFDGKIAIHPAQAAVIAEAFRTPDELTSWAHRVLTAFDASATGAFRFEGQMVDQPHYKLARRIVDAES